MLYRNTTLGNRLQQSFHEGSLNMYGFCDNVWTFVLNDVEFRGVTELIKVDKVKIVACDGKNTLQYYRMNRRKWLFFFFFLSLLGPHLWHMEVPGLRVQLEL
uniref:Transcription initiation factor IIA subunit 2 n=1 Tax=Sus scrofa TaxID=9823 RepID=A0A4X1UBQ9_PIG